MKSLSENVMSSLGLQGQRNSRVDPVAAVNKVKASKKDLKAKAYKAALLDLLYLQVVTGQIPGGQGMMAPQGMTGGYPQAGPMVPGMHAMSNGSMMPDSAMQGMMV